MAPIKISSTPFSDVFRRDDGTQFEVPRGLFGAAGPPMMGTPPPPAIGAPSLGVGPLMPPNLPPPPAAPPPPPLAGLASGAGSALAAGGAPPVAALPYEQQLDVVGAKKLEAGKAGAEATAGTEKLQAQGEQEAAATRAQQLQDQETQRAQAAQDAAKQAQGIADEEKANAAKAGESVYGSGAGGVVKAILTAMLGVAGGIVGVKSNNPQLGVQLVNNIISSAAARKEKEYARAKELTEGKRKTLAEQTDASQKKAEADYRTSTALYEQAQNAAKAKAAEFGADSKAGASLLAMDAGLEESKLDKRNAYGKQLFDQKIAAQNAATAAGGLALATKGQALTQMNAERNYDLEVKKLAQAGKVAEAAAMEKAKEQTVFGVNDPKTGKPMVAQDAKRATAANSLLSDANQRVNDIETFRKLHAALPEALTRTGAASAGLLGRPEMLQEPFKSQLIEYNQLRDKLESGQVGGQKIQQADGTVVTVPLINVKLNLGALTSPDPSVVDKQKQLIRDSIRGDVTTALKNEIGYTGQPITFDAEAEAAAATNAERNLSTEGEIQPRTDLIPGGIQLGELQRLLRYRR